MKGTLYYIDGYVYEVPSWMSKKEAKKEYGIIFDSHRLAENYRLASIMGG